MSNRPVPPLPPPTPARQPRRVPPLPVPAPTAEHAPSPDPLPATVDVPTDAASARALIGLLRRVLAHAETLCGPGPDPAREAILAVLGEGPLPRAALRDRVRGSSRAARDGYRAALDGLLAEGRVADAGAGRPLRLVPAD